VGTNISNFDIPLLLVISQKVAPDVYMLSAAVFNGIIVSRLEGVDRRKLKFTTLNTLQAGVSVRIKSESGREGNTNQPRK
jgi:hypothetical protein